ncbi:MAG: TolC family protein, partial [Duodenibacillus sp.]|nr:TolC family protein [Duodenibacillus sp.]
ARSYGLGLSASYELDLWGRVAATVESSRRSLEAAELDLAAARVSVAGSVATAWVNLLAARDERAVIVRQIATNEELYSIRKAEYENGRATGLQLIAQLETLESVRARLPAIEQTIARYENALAILMGEAPGAAAMAGLMPRGGLGPVPGAFAAGLPAAVIAARPDVQSLWRAALAAAWDVSALKAERLPKIRLSASLAFSAAEPGLVFDNWVRSLGAALGLDLFDGGAREARIDRARSLARSALISYAQGVASALEEVDNALVREARQREILEQTERRVALARLSLEQARLAWQQGSENFSTYMNKLESLQALERSAVTQKGEVMLARIALMRALAGDAADEQATQGSQP